MTRRNVTILIMCVAALLGLSFWQSIARVPGGSNPLGRATFNSPNALAAAQQVPQEGVIDVRSFGAVGDGITDDTTAIQVAINTAAAARRMVHLPGGTYLVTDTLRLPTGAYVVGDTGSQQIVSYGAQPKGTTIIFDPTSEKNLFEFTGSLNAGNYRGEYSIRGVYAKGNTVGGVTLSKYGLDLDHVNNSVFEDIVLENFQVGIRCEFTMTNVLFKCHISGCATACVWYDNTSSPSTSDVWEVCIFHYSPVGIQTSGSSVGIRFDNCLFETLANYGMNLVKETYCWQVTQSYCEDVPGDKNVNGCMFRCGYDGRNVAIENMLTVIGGNYGGRNAGWVGNWLDVNDCNGVMVVSPQVTRYNYAIRATTSTLAGTICINGMQGTTWGGGFYTGPTGVLQGTYPDGVLNLGAAYGQYAELKRLYTSRLQPNSAGTGTLTLGGTYQQWQGALHPASDLAQSLGLSNLRVAEIYGQHYYSYNGKYRSDLVASVLTGNRVQHLPDTSGSIVVAASVSHDYSSGEATWTMTTAEAGASFFAVTNAGGVTNAVFPTAVPGKQFTVYNNSGRAIAFRVAGQTGAATTNGKYSLWTMNATDCVKIYEQP